MEAADLRIIDLLREDGRISYTDLGKAVGLSTSAVHQRVRRLEERGIITSYTAQVDPAALGTPLTAFVSVTPLDPRDPDDIPDRLRGIAQIDACYSVAGDSNYLLRVRVGTPQDLEELLSRVRSQGGVSTRTTIVLTTPWE
ncbi:Lrp/AsnC family transcriptional regulator [Janibacter corallicola]|uniref:Lrp/AsnC family transcriptional regulator n=1 Tax=Janibacter corallicola TaxID=415212 RepID=UPI000835EB6C|nr:Lrp/AsnC family transcriptional regulator [Janibacter corallicola]